MQQRQAGVIHSMYLLRGLVTPEAAYCAAVLLLRRLSTLRAAGNSLAGFPDVLGPFTCLSYLDLSHNRLSGSALLPLGHLPALQQLLLGHNPVRSAPEGLAGPGVGADSSNSSAVEQAGTAAPPAAAADDTCSGGSRPSSRSAGVRFSQLQQLDLSHTKVKTAKHLLALLVLPRLAVLQLTGTPLAARCWSGGDPIKVCGWVSWA